MLCDFMYGKQGVAEEIFCQFQTQFKIIVVRGDVVNFLKQMDAAGAGKWYTGGNIVDGDIGCQVLFYVVFHNHGRRIQNHAVSQKIG